MKDQLQQYAEDFSTQLEIITHEDSEQRSVNHPVVFLFLGDLVTDALKSIITINKEKWHNSSGVLYFHAYQTETVTNENVLSVKLPGADFDQMHKRKQLSEDFYKDDQLLIELNTTFRRLTVKIAEYGKVYSSLRKMNLCVVTSVDDPANIVIQELTLLLKSILQESFKAVEVDLYGLIKEKQDGENFALSASFGISFLKELDNYQQDLYSFAKPLQLTEDRLSLPVVHPPAPLFDLVYLLSDKNENGLLAGETLKQNYTIISNLNLLKNRKLMSDYHEKMDSYNHAAFRKAIKGNSSKPVYASAGFAKIKRPNKAIALFAASLFFNEMIRLLQSSSSQPIERILDLFDLNEAAFTKHYRSLIPSQSLLEDMDGLIGTTNSYQEVKRLTVKQAEEYLFGSGTEQFFFSNITETTEQELQRFQLKSHIKHCLNEKIIHNENYGIYCAYIWTSDDNKPSVLAQIEKMMRETKNKLLAAESQIEQLYQQQVDHCDFRKTNLPFADKKNLQSYLRYFFKTVYGTKYEIIKFQIKLAILKQYQVEIEDLHRDLQKKINSIEQVQSFLMQEASESLHDSDEYLDKNIPEYYTTVMSEIIAKLKEKRGANFFTDERFFGSLLPLLETGKSKILERLLSVCQREILNQSYFHRSFEDELLERANTRSNYENRDVLSQEDLFKQLYLLLHENAAIQIEVYNYTQEHRHEESYFIGDFYSKFIDYALERENEARHYKVGCAHEKNSTGIEKLTLMGGFQIKDLLYYRNGERYYQAYVEKGYYFHSPVVAKQKDCQKRSKEVIAGELGAYSLP